jgi:formyltetrahydrofolate synthetase
MILAHDLFRAFLSLEKARLLKKYNGETVVNVATFIELTDCEMEIESIKKDCKLDKLSLKSS